ncbi:methyltransferase domain-containing protein [Cyanobium sp. FGCU-6]|jgi:hypothetical protein|nr:methyltransferase domain-containing protein [Cyanobium sp. FGCU6]
MKTESHYIAPRLAGLGPRLAWKVRQDLYNEMIERLHPTQEWSILDAGVTSDRTLDSNFFERLYPFPNQITAVGLEDASFLEHEYPGLKFVLADACELPFEDNAFHLAFCSAVIEHVGSRTRQRKLLQELTRVSRIAVVTTPNRFFPLEFHTITPLLHWLPARFFRGFLRLTGREFFAREANLNLLDEKTIEKMLVSSGISFAKHPYFLLGIKSNLVYYTHK